MTYMFILTFFDTSSYRPFFILSLSYVACLSGVHIFKSNFFLVSEIPTSAYRDFYIAAVMYITG